MKKIKVLQLFTKVFEVGGEEEFVFNVVSNIKNKNIEIDFFAQYDNGNEEYRKKIMENGSNFFGIKKENDNLIGKISYFKKVRQFLENKNYDIIHIHSGNMLGMVLSIMYVRKYCNFIIIHAHNTGIKTWKNQLLKKIFTKKLLMFDKYIANSYNTAVFRFPNRIVRNNNFEIIKCGINYEKFEFNVDVREKYRKLIGVTADENIIGFVGRLEDQKDPIKLIDIFSELYKIDKSYKLVIVGEGSLRQQIIEKSKQLNLQDRIIMLGTRRDVNNLMQAFDCFILPSKYEGLGIVAIEAQAACLPTFVSSAIPEEANVSNLFYKIDIESEPLNWALCIHSNIKGIERRNMSQRIKESGYDIKEIAKKIEYIYEVKK